MMNKTITAVFADRFALQNVVDDLVNKDIPREKIYADEESSQVKVIMPESATAEVVEILNRHRPTQLN